MEEFPVELEDRIVVHRGLIADGLAGQDEAGLVDDYCRSLRERGFPLTRFSVGAQILHPLHEGRSIVWREGEDLSMEFHSPIPVGEMSVDWERSPFRALIEGEQDEIRRRLDSNSFDPEEFSLLEDFRNQGMTDYLALRVAYRRESTLGGPYGVVMSYVTDRTGGFPDIDIEALRELSRTFSLSFRAMAEVFTGRTLMRTYVGGDAARRIIEGAIRRGHAESLNAVLWYSDLRGFTRIADTVAREELMPLLNDYAECQVDAVTSHGGEVIKFMGDGMLAMFEASDQPAACRAALDAAILARSSTMQLTERRKRAGLPTTGIYLGLNLGEVLYGNIGSSQRLDFTVIGPTVNEVARIVSMCRALDQSLVISSAFARACPDGDRRLVSLGRYALRGVSRPQELFTLDIEAALNGPSAA